MSKLIISSLNQHDKACVFELLQTSAVMQYLGPRRVLNDEEALEWFTEALNTPSRFVFRLADSHELVGFCGVKQVDGKPDFGYFLRQKYWQQGFAKQMCRMAVKQLNAQNVDLSQLHIFVARNNIASLRIANAFGWIKIESTYNGFEQGWRFQMTI